MCGRYANVIDTWDDWAEAFQPWPADAVATGYNIAPSMSAPALTSAGVQSMQWGLTPAWSAQASARYATFNARLETVAAKPTFKQAWRQGQTCLVPALGYYEWRSTRTGKQPYFIRAKHGQPLVFAGLYEPARHDNPATFTIMTRAADPAMSRLHPRMPVLAAVRDAAGWLSGDTDCAIRMQRPALRVYAVGAQVNPVRNDDASLVTPLAGPTHSADRFSA